MYAVVLDRKRQIPGEPGQTLQLDYNESWGDEPRSRPRSGLA
jgi:hypothetical protein